MNELGERGSTQRMLGRKFSDPLLKLPFELQVQKMIKSDQAHYLHSSAPPFSLVPLSSFEVKCKLLSLAVRLSLI